MLSENVVFSDRYDRRAFAQIKGKAQKLQALEDKGLEKLKSYSLLLQDLYSILYKADPILKPKEQVRASERINRTLVEKIIDTKQYPELREYTYLNEFASSMAVLELGQVVLKLIPEEVKKQINDIKDKEENELQDQANQAQAASQKANDAQNEADDAAQVAMQAQAQAQANQQNQVAQQMAAQARQQAQEAQAQANQLAQQAQSAQMSFEQAQEKLAKQAESLEEKLEREMGEKIRQALRKATKDALEQTQETSEMLEAWGVEPGEIQNLPYEEKMELAEKLKNDKKLKEVAKILGRFRRMALSKQKEKTQSHTGAITRLRRGNDLKRMHSSEALKLTHPYFRYDFMSRWAKKQLLIYETEKKETLAQGPVIVCIDNSGSIESAQEIWEKALAIGLYQASDYKNRHFVFIQYGGPEDPLTEIEIRPGEANYKKLLQVAKYFLGGGTDFEKPLKKAREYIEKGMKADIVFITDGECAVSQEFLMSFNQARKDTPFSVFSVLLTKGGSSSTATVEKFSDEIFTIEDLTVEEASEIFARV